jgi:hypothetical protein
MEVAVRVPLKVAEGPVEPQDLGNPTRQPTVLEVLGDAPLIPHRLVPDRRDTLATAVTFLGGIDGLDGRRETVGRVAVPIPAPVMGTVLDRGLHVGHELTQWPARGPG